MTINIGDKVMFMNNEHEIVGVDQAPKHPSNVAKHWEMLLRNMKTKELVMVLNSEVTPLTSEFRK